MTQEQADAQADLFAAAPELVEALRAALEQEAGNRPADGEPMPWEVQAAALLARVRGDA